MESLHSQVDGRMQAEHLVAAQGGIMAYWAKKEGNSPCVEPAKRGTALFRVVPVHVSGDEGSYGNAETYTGLIPSRRADGLDAY